jgi:MoxR-like ATPase
MHDAIAALLRALAAERYIADRGLATTVYLAGALAKPVLLEGEAGVGKTELAKALARVRGARLIRLQCYEGLDATHALYEWNYARQLLRIRLAEATGHAEAGTELERSLFGEEFLIRRPLLEAITCADATPPVLLIDEVDRADEEFEAFLLEVLSDFQITIPELGTLRARQTPFVVLTSNRTRELHDALKRRCLYHWLAYPSLETEYQIVRARVPEADVALAAQICRFMAGVRTLPLYKRPGIAETLDWAAALAHLHRDALDDPLVRETAGVILKYNEDVESLRRQLDQPGWLEGVTRS